MHMFLLLSDNNEGLILFFTISIYFKIYSFVWQMFIEQQLSAWHNIEEFSLRNPQPGGKTPKTQCDVSGQMPQRSSGMTLWGIPLAGELRNDQGRLHGGDIAYTLSLEEWEEFASWKR